MDHDRLFKELLSNFFFEFLDLFLPRVCEYLDKDFDLVPLDKEIFTDVTSGESHEVDLVMRVKFRGEEAFFLIHVEAQASVQADFPRRMFLYFARLTQKYGLPVYPVVIFSHDTPLRPEPNHYRVSFPDRTVLQFEYAAIQLNRLPWRRFVGQTNPVAIALMAKMKIAPTDRPKVKLECLRLLASLNLDPAKSRLIGGFVDSYLQLTAQEMARYEREFVRLAQVERDSTMALISSWEQRGIEKGIEQGIEQGKAQGIEQGKEEIVLRLLQHKFGILDTSVLDTIGRLSAAQLDDLAEATLDFISTIELQAWLARG